MDLYYYPGCTLKTKAKGFEDSAIACLDALGVALKEIPRWNCCGAVYSLADDDLMHHLAPIRNLIRAKELNQNKLMVLCSLCFNTLKRANLMMRTMPDKREAINAFMDEEPDYNGEVEVVHLLEVLRDDIGWDKISSTVKKPLTNLKLASYYGCALLRPKEISIDAREKPVILDNLIKSLGSEAIDFPSSNRCCGSFQVVGNPEVAIECSQNVLKSAAQHQVEALVISCPLCDLNLAGMQEKMAQNNPEFKMVPTIYFTQLMALAFGLDQASCHFDMNYSDPRPLLKAKGLL